MKNIIDKAIVFTLALALLASCSKENASTGASLDGVWYLDVEATLAPNPGFPRDIMEYFWAMHGTSLEIDLKRGEGKITFPHQEPRDFALLVRSDTEAALTRSLVEDPFSPDQEDIMLLAEGKLHILSRHYLNMVFVAEMPEDVSKASLSGKWRLDEKRSAEMFPETKQGLEEANDAEPVDIPLEIDAAGGTMNFGGGDPALNVPIALGPDKGKVFHGIILEPGLGRSMREFILVAHSDGSLLFVHNDLKGVFVRAE